MKREIKFRAWNPVDKRMILAEHMCQYGTLSDERGIRYGFDSSGCHFMMYEKHIIDPIQDFILMQFTGLKDKNGTEIYEGDIVKKNWYPVKNIVVEFSNGKFNISDYVAMTRKLIVLGSIYEHPNLLTNG